MSERRFRIMGGPSVPWRLVEPYGDNAKRNHDQTLERLNERGGLSPGELWCIVHSKRWREQPGEEQALTWLKAWLERDSVATIVAERDSLRSQLAARDEKLAAASAKIERLNAELTTIAANTTEARIVIQQVAEVVGCDWQGDVAGAVRKVIAERDAYRAGLADLLAATHEGRDDSSATFYRSKARDLLKNGTTTPGGDRE